MASYRLYLLNPISERIERFEELAANADEEAVAAAHRIAPDHAVEPWNKSRKICRLGPPRSDR